MKREKVAIVGAGIGGLTCASLLKESHHIEMFEAAKEESEARPLQMEGAVHYLGIVPDLEPSYPITHLVLESERERATLTGKLGWHYTIGGEEGLDTRLRREVAKEVEIHMGTRITSLDQLSGFDHIIAADGHRSRISLLAGMRGERPDALGVGIGLTVRGRFRTGYNYALFDDDYAPGGYLNLIPIDGERASLVSACIGNGINSRRVRGRLYDFAGRQNLEVLNEWADIESWYPFQTYQKDNVHVIGGAASFTDRVYGFGLKYAIWSARLCAHSIVTGEDYNALLAPVLKELDFWKRMAEVLVNTTNREKDAMVRMARFPPVKFQIERGGSLKRLFPVLAWYFKTRRRVNLSLSAPTSQSTSPASHPSPPS